MATEKLEGLGVLGKLHSTLLPILMNKNPPPPNGMASGSGSRDQEESRLIFRDQQEGKGDRNLSIIISELEN